MLVVYCPTCGTPIETEEYNNPRMRICLNCRTVWEIIEQPKLSWVLANRKEDEA